MRQKLAILCVTFGTFLVAVKATHPVGSAQWNSEENRVAKFIDDAEQRLLENAEKHTFVEWAYESNITDHNEKIKLRYQVGLITLLIY